jgi:hypothetical protein
MSVRTKELGDDVSAEDTAKINDLLRQLTGGSEENKFFAKLNEMMPYIRTAQIIGLCIAGYTAYRFFTKKRR